MDPIVLGSGEGELLQATHRDIRVKVSRRELDLLEFDADAGFEGPGPHYHKRHVDSFFVLEGELEVTVGDETVRAGPGTLVSAPPGVVHAFTVPGPARARFLNIHAPDCGFTEYVRRASRGDDVNPEDYDIWELD